MKDSDEKMTMRKLTSEEVQFCRLIGIEVGYEVDDDQPQGTHLCWPIATGLGALCDSDRLWFQGGNTGDEGFDCKACHFRLATLMRSRDDELLTAFSALLSEYRAAFELCDVVTDFLGGFITKEDLAEAGAKYDRHFAEVAETKG